MEDRVLVVNAGSSSLKLGLYERRDGDVTTLWDGSVDGIASADTLREGIRRMEGEIRDARVGAVGHRIVHGGPHLVEHRLLDDSVKKTLRDSVHFAPLHLPAALTLIDAATDRYPGVPQVACFDTAFHRTLPEKAARLPIPSVWYDRGVRRYGFHGLSYESIVHQLGATIPARVVVAHLGSGASVTALRNGRSVDTSMGMTPTGGIVMATRSGDLDPGVLVYLAREGKLSADALEQLLDHESGLQALSGGSHDMRELERSSDPRAAFAIDVFCTSVRKRVASYAAVLGGLDLLVLTGGIGEHSTRIRAEIQEGLTFLTALEVRVLPSQEDLQIARHTFELWPKPREASDSSRG